MEGGGTYAAHAASSDDSALDVLHARVVEIGHNSL